MKLTLNFPELAEPYVTALRDAVAFVLTRTQPIGIVASGTIIRGHPDRSSDIDLYVIHDQPWRQRVQKFFNGVPTEIFINPPAAIERYFVEEHEDGRPMTAHMLATGFVVAVSDPRVDQLIGRAKVLVVTPPRYGAATLFEDALDVVDHDQATAAMLLTRSVITMLEYFFMCRAELLPRGKELLTAIAALDAEIGAAAQCFFESGSWEDRLEAATIIADRMIGARGFFEWESEPNAC